MKKILISFIGSLILLNLSPVFSITPSNKSEINWTRNWSEKIFEKAKKENKLVILDLEAVWCHWCHVMHETTYTESKVIDLINSRFIPVRIDHDLRPDLANKYRNYGWPATIIFNSDGKEVLKKAGYIPRDEFLLELKKVIENPVPEKEELDETKIKFAGSPFLQDTVKEKLIQNHKDAYDPEVGGLYIFQKYIDRDSLEYSLIQSQNGNDEEKEMAKKTLDGSLMLIDPVWGGVYQYSTMGDWNYPHFEKLGFLQGEYMRTYSLAYSVFKDPLYLMAATDIHRYIKTFLTGPDGSFYTSQDADLVQGEHSSEYFVLNDTERRSKGIPNVDKHIYSSQNGLIINGLTSLYKETLNKDYLNDAVKAAEWVVQNRKIRAGLTGTLKWIFSSPSSDLIFHKIKWIFSNMTWYAQGYRHDEVDAAGPFLCDNLNMAIAFLSLYDLTGQKKWKIRAEQTARFIDKYFYAPIVGFQTAASSCEVCAVGAPTRKLDENILLARFFTRLYRLTNNSEYKALAEHAMKYIVTGEIALQSLTEPGVLIADIEFKKAVKAN